MVRALLRPSSLTTDSIDNHKQVLLEEQEDRGCFLLGSRRLELRLEEEDTCS
jgi:hypothetical protein